MYRIFSFEYWTTARLACQSIFMALIIICVGCSSRPPPPPPAKIPQTGTAVTASSPSLKQTKGVPAGAIKKKEKGIARNSFDYSLAVSGDIAEIPGSQQASSGILVDLNSRKVFWSKNATKPVPIASMTKMMTALLAMEDLDSGKHSFDTLFEISGAAVMTGGTRVPLSAGESLTFRDLLSAMMVASTNDASYAIAENIGGGDISSFIGRMNLKANSLGFKNMRFFNPHGMPGATYRDDNIASPEELARLAEILLGYPELVKISSSPMIYLDRKSGDEQRKKFLSTNFLIRNKFPGVNGMKTGYTDRAGYCLTATCERNGRRLIGVATGFKTRGARDDFMRKLLDWGYARKVSKKVKKVDGQP